MLALLLLSLLLLKVTDGSSNSLLLTAKYSTPSECCVITVHLIWWGDHVLYKEFTHRTENSCEIHGSYSSWNKHHMHTETRQNNEQLA